jgi:hypothetical protein
LEDYEKNDHAISCLESFEEYKPSIFEDEGTQNYKVKLVEFQNYEQNVAIRRLFERIIESKGIESKKTIYSEQFPVYKLKNISKAILDDLKKSEIFEALFSIEPMPKYIVALDMMEDEQSIHIMQPEKDKEYVTIGILDNGIEPIPHLSPWLSNERWTVYPEDSINPTHGTFVAGVALYGDVCEGKDWVGHNGVKLFDATVFPDTEKEGIDEDELIENIKEVISGNHDKIKIWNLSISIVRPVSDDKFSDFAIALDSLQDNYNVLICKSAGNCENFISGKTKGRIHEGADSVRSLVVGSIAHAKGEFDFAEVDNPSPFSRIGPGPEYIIKPEISHYGGNAGINSNGHTITGVKSFSKDGSLSSSAGTSFSTPRVTSLAAGIYQELNEEFDPILLKALIVHSASYSKDLIIPSNERTKELGFGMPKVVNDIIYNAPHEATLVEYCQSNIDVKFGSYDEKTERDVSKQHILNPVGREGAKNLFRDSLYSKKKMKRQADDFALRERLLIQYGDKYYPVKKYAVDLSELTEGNMLSYLTEDKRWYLYLKGLFRDHIERKASVDSIALSQEFCLILTIRDPSGKENVYDEVTQKLEELNFWHSNIKIASDVSISL